MTAIMNREWEKQAACRGMNPDLFFPEFGFLLEPDVPAACGRCPVRGECLDYAITHDEQGVWGGLTDDQRKRINITRSRVRCPDCRSDQVAEQRGSEVCLSCGLSWPA